MTPNPSSTFFGPKKGLRLNAENCRSRGTVSRMRSSGPAGQKKMSFVLHAAITG